MKKLQLDCCRTRLTLIPFIMSWRMSFWKLFLLAGGRVKGVGECGTEAEPPSSCG